MENEKMTIFYKRRTLEIDAVCEGEQSLRFYGGDIEDMQLIYGCIVMDYDIVVLRNNKSFYIEQGENGELSLKMKDEFKEDLMKYLTA